MNRLFGVVLISLFLLQLAVPASMIFGREMTLKYGEPFRFRTAPVDPYDPFRGRFVVLNLEGASVPKPQDRILEYGQKVLVRLAVDEEGFAYCSEIVSEETARGTYLSAQVLSWDNQRVRLQLPFDRYYANEKLAPEIERAYFSRSRPEQRGAYIQVRVRRGQGVLEELYIDDLPVLDYLRRQALLNPEE